LTYLENIGAHLSIDEERAPQRGLDTFITNKSIKGKKRTFVACIKGTKSQDIINGIYLIPLEKRKLIKEITLDMANNMQWASRICFSMALWVTDHFHVVKLVMQPL
jgi:succinate dehydrogenase/fumarate reductase cytochrome b subunit